MINVMIVETVLQSAQESVLVSLDIVYITL